MSAKDDDQPAPMDTEPEAGSAAGAAVGNANTEEGEETEEGVRKSARGGGRKGRVSYKKVGGCCWVGRVVH